MPGGAESSSQAAGGQGGGGRGPAAALFGPLSGRLARAHGEPAFRRDPELIRSQLRLGRALFSYFSPEVRGLSHLPESGPVLVVGNHSGSFYMPDAWLTGMAVTERRGVDTPVYSLAYDLLFAAPGLGGYLRRLGVLPADPTRAEAALGEGAAVIVYPGGDYEACRPWHQAGLVDFGGHLGFIRVALRAGAPVVPVVAHGSHSALVVLDRGDRIARALGLDRLRIRVFPIVVGPLGLPSPIVPAPPLPSSIIVRFLPALDWSHLRDEAGDDTTVHSCYDEITKVMQAAMDELRAERPHPVLTGAGRLAGRLPRAVEGLAPWTHRRQPPSAA